MIEEKLKHVTTEKAAAPATLEDTSFNIRREADESGAAAAAGVLTAIDEDEGGEEADVPEEFQYFTDYEDEA